MSDNYKNVLDRYDALISKCDRFERKGKTMPYTSANGHMFSLFNKAGELGIRFSEKVKKEYIEKYNTTEFRSYGAVMRGYILITDELWSDDKQMLSLLNESYDYVMTLEPK